MNNGRRYPFETKEEARVLRFNGFTHREIAEKIHASHSIVFEWTKKIRLTLKQKKEIKNRLREKYRQKLPYFRDKLSQQAKITLSPFWKKRPSEKELIKKIRIFYKKHNRIPLKREFSLWGTYWRVFGSWNNAIRKAGFEPNPEIFTKKFTARDGHICDSLAERIIDDWLLRHDLPHKRNIRYGDTRMTADFGIGKIRIEYFGLAGEIKSYDKNILKKEIYARKMDCRSSKFILGICFPKIQKNSWVKF